MGLYNVAQWQALYYPEKQRKPKDERMIPKEETQYRRPVTFYGLRSVLKKLLRLCLSHLAEQD